MVIYMYIKKGSARTDHGTGQSRNTYCTKGLHLCVVVGGGQRGYRVTGLCLQMPVMGGGDEGVYHSVNMELRLLSSKCA